MDHFFNRFGFSSFLLTPSDVSSKYPDYSDIEKIGVDKIYFSGNRPSVFVLEVDSFNDNALKRIAQIHRNAWNYRKVLLLYVSSDTEVRIYNCHQKPSQQYTEDSLAHLELERCSNKTEDITNILYFYSRINIDCGTILNDSQYQKRINTNQRIDTYLIQSLKEAKDRLNKNNLSDDITYSLLIRSLFILFLEHRGATQKTKLYESIKSDCHSFFDILKDKEATYTLFKKLQSHFNGNITPIVSGEEQAVTIEHLKIIYHCFYDGDFSESPKLFEQPLFDFSIIGVELISEIYQVFLGESRHQKGQFYTPYPLVDLILADKLPTNSPNYNVSILDPSCGSGIFLVESFRHLIKRWKKAHQKNEIPFEESKQLLLKNIYGIDIDSQAIHVAAFSLYLALIEEMDANTLWTDESYRLPYLINDSSSKIEQGGNLLCKNTISEINPESLPSFDLIIGNPPFGSQNLEPDISNYCNEKHFQQEYAIPFLHKAISFTCNGSIAMIIPSKILFNTHKTAKNFRDWLFNSNYVEKIYNLSIYRNTPKIFGGSLFSDTSCPISVIYYSHLKPQDSSETITYVAPKTYIKSGVIFGLLIDNSDVKELPRSECGNINSNIWKIAMWGNRNIYDIIHKYQRVTLNDYFKNNWTIKSGLNADKKCEKEWIQYKVLKPNSFERYYTEMSPQNTSIKNFRKIDSGFFNPPIVVFKKGQKHLQIVCSLIEDQPIFFTSDIYGMKGGNINDQKLLTAYLNSDLAKFFLFFSSSSWGIEREQIFLKEIKNLPSPFEYCTNESKKMICGWFDEIVKLKKNFLSKDDEIKQYELQIFKEFINVFSLSKKDVNIIQDALKYNLDIFEKHTDSIGYKHVTIDDFHTYNDCLISSLSRFLKSSSYNVSSTLYHPNAVPNPLNLITISFGKSKESTTISSSSELTKLLNKLDQQLIKEKSSGVYVKQNLKIYDDNKIYIVKPNQKRFWSKMEAYDDASSIIADILNMETV